MHWERFSVCLIAPHTKWRILFLGAVESGRGIHSLRCVVWLLVSFVYPIVFLSLFDRVSRPAGLLLRFCWSAKASMDDARLWGWIEVRGLIVHG